MVKLTKKDGLKVMFSDGVNTTSAFISLAKIKELIMDEAYEMITIPECNSSSCAVNNFCECDPVNEDMEFAGIYVSVGK